MSGRQKMRLELGEGSACYDVLVAYHAMKHCTFMGHGHVVLFLCLLTNKCGSILT